jgi:GR25 family glycosyltransferase involved in LPS biosynthesis
MSHLSAWQEVSEADRDWTLILEDDTEAVIPIPRCLDGFGMPEDAEICFINERLAPPIPTEEQIGREFLPLVCGVRARSGRMRAPGADAYLLSRQAARKLLDATRAVAIDGDIDWRLVALCLSPSEISNSIGDDRVRRILERYRRGASQVQGLRAYTSSTPFIATRSFGSTRRLLNASEIQPRYNSEKTEIAK